MLINPDLNPDLSAAELARLAQENAELKQRLREAEETLQAIQSGDVDALVVAGTEDGALYTLVSADRPYRLLIEEMKQGALILSVSGHIAYCNRGFAALVQTTAEQLRGQVLADWIAPDSAGVFEALLRLAQRDGAAGEVLLVAADGTDIPVYLTANVLSSEDALDLCLVVTDLREQKRQEALIAAENLSRSILEQTAEILVVCDCEGRIIRASHVAGRFSDDNPLLQPFLQAFPLHYSIDPLAECTAAPVSLEPVLGGNTLHNIDVCLERPDGRRFELLLNAGPLRSGQRIIGFVVTLTDITRRKQAEAALRLSEERARQLAEAMPQIVYILRADGEIIFLNQRWYDYTGLGWEDTRRGRYIDTVLHADDLPTLRAAWKQAQLAATTYAAEVRMKPVSGDTYRWFLSRAVPMRDEYGQVTEWFGTLTDIDDQKRTQFALKDADRRKDEFLAILGHELRNPLAGIDGGVQLLCRGEAQDVPRLARRVADYVAQMAAIINDLLDISRVTRGRIDLRREAVPLATALEHTIESVRPLFDDYHHRLSIDLPLEPVYLDADPIRFEQIMANLLTNAAKYTDTGGRIELRARCDAGQVAISVSDNGIGIPADRLEQIFEPFAQIRDDSYAKGGLGIGLTLVRQLVELHGGQITVSSAGAGRGSCFTVTLPAGAPPPHAPAAVIEQPRLRPGLKVLIVDDNTSAAEGLSLLLEMFGAAVRTAFDGASALTEAYRYLPDVVLLDIGLPDINGYAVAEQLRRQDGLTEALLIAVSGFGHDEARQRARQAGFNHHLVKPVALEALLRLLPQA